MSSLASLLFVSALAAIGGQSTPASQSPQPQQASLSFVSQDQILAGITYGIDAIDAQPQVFGRRLSANVSAGQKTIWYSCPNEPQVAGGSRITFDFKAGSRYELVCRSGKDAEIRSSDEC